MSVLPGFHNLTAYAIQIALLALTGALLPKIFRVRDPGALLAYWQLLLVACLALPLMAQKQIIIVPSATASGIVLSDAGSVTLPANSQPARRVVNWNDVSWRALLFVIAAGGTLRLAQLVLGLLKLQSLRRNSRRLEELPPGLRKTASFAPGEVEILISPDIPSPATYGCLRSTILLPAQFERLDTGEQVSILCHELIHVRRRDWPFALGEQLILVGFWFHPAVWWLVRRIELTREQLVDREVLALPVDRHLYLKSLLCSAGGRAALLSANLFLTRHHLKERVALLLEEVHMSRARFITSLCCMGLLFCAGAALATRAFPLTGSVISGPPRPAASSLPLPPPSPSESPSAPQPSAAASAKQKVVPVAPRPAEANKATAGQSVSGVVVNPEGSPLSSVLVRVIDPGTKNVVVTGLTDERGSFNLLVPIERPVDFSLSKDGFIEIKIKEVKLTRGMLTNLKYVMRRPGATEGMFVRPVQIPRPIGDAPGPGSITGVVVDPAGVGVPQVNITVAEVESGNTVFKSFTDKQGNFNLDLRLQSKADIAFIKAGFKPNLIKGVVAGDAPVTLRVSLQLAAGSDTVTIRPGVGVVAEGQAVPGDGSTISARVVQRVDPPYPPEAVQQGLEATVVIEALVDANGTIAGLRVIRGDPVFDAAAVNAVKQWRCSPASLNGQPVQGLLIVTLIFKL